MPLAALKASKSLIARLSANYLWERATKGFYIDGEMIIDRIAQYNCGRVIRFLLTMARSLAHALER